MPSPAHAQLRRINLDGSSPEVVARGIRQVVGMDWHPALGQLYFTENSRDWLSEDIPEDKLNRLTQPSKDNFGFASFPKWQEGRHPHCHFRGSNRHVHPFDPPG
jgi:glucose/arabinose dehydrogenase